MYERFTHRRRLAGTTTFDMTPLMDLTFTLLIVFIITVPVLDYTSDVTPPKMSTPTEVNDETMRNAALVDLNEEGEVKVDGNAVIFGELQEYFARLASTGLVTKIIIRADGSRPYEEVIGILRAAKNAGLGIQLMTQAETSLAE